MHQKVQSRDLKIGMFVADLDRPWIDTPFLLQGFLVEDDEQLRQLRQHCQWVMIDAARSVGGEFDSPAKKAAQPAREVGHEPRVVIHHTTAPRPSAVDPAPVRQNLTAAPGARKAGDSRNDDRPARAREFAVATKDSRSAAGRPLSRSGANDNSGANATPAAEPADSPSRSFWGKLREGVSGLFAKSDAENLDLDAAADIAEEPGATAPVRPSFIPETVQLTIYEDNQPVEAEIGAASVAFQRTNDLLHRVVEDIRAGNDLQLEGVEEVINDMVDSMVRNPDALMWVARMRERDLSIYGHGLAVAVSLVAFGRHLGYPKDQLSLLGLLGLLLDIGKIKLPRELLEKSARLSSEEFELIKDHVDLGVEILSQTPNMHPDVLEGIAQHHERMNGTGYPNSLMGDKIGVFGRMAAIADTYAAVTKSRPYAAAVSPHEALQMLSNWSGSQFQADMVEQFIQSIGVFPVGSLVELSTGEIAVIVTHNKQKRLRPKVLVVTAADKTHNKHPALRDLLYDVSENPAYIRRGLPSNSFGIDPSEYYLH